MEIIFWAGWAIALIFVVLFWRQKWQPDRYLGKGGPLESQIERLQDKDLKLEERLDLLQMKKGLESSILEKERKIEELLK